MPLRLLSLLCIAALLLMPAQGQAWDDLSVEKWLAEPGVKLLAVEFYATWCKPCQEAIPKWKKLQKKYRAKGLRLVVVAVQSEGSCSSPDWVPDKVVCDFDGSIAERWHSQDLPQAFLWSWQGNSLVANGSVEQVEGAVKDFFASVPRILVAPPEDLRGDKLPRKLSRQVKHLVRSELKRASKFDLVADEKEREELRKLRKAGHAANFDEDTQCKLGEEVSPNSQLKITVAETNRGTKLRLELFSLEKGCLTASSHAPVIDRDYEAAAVEAVAKLVRSLLGEVKVPGGGTEGTVAAAAPTLGGYEEFARAADLAAAKSAELEKSWAIVERVVGQDGVRKEQKVAALEKFLAEYQDRNPHKSEARGLLRGLTARGSTETSWVTVGLAGPMHVPAGGLVEIYRRRHSRFQWAALSCYYYPFDAGNEDAENYEKIDVWGVGVGGLGARWSPGASGMHELGFLSFPLSYGVFSRNNFKDLGSAIDVATYTLLHTKLYYRVLFGAWHLEAGLVVPLFWLAKTKRYPGIESNTDEAYGFRGIAPFLYYFGGGF